MKVASSALGEVSIPDAIEASEVLNRRLKPDQVDDDNSPLAVAFMGRPPHEVSVDRARYRPAEDTLLSHEGFGICALTAEGAQEITGVAPTPDKSAHNQAHALIRISPLLSGSEPGGALYEVWVRLAEASRIVVAPSWKRYREEYQPRVKAERAAAKGKK